MGWTCWLCGNAIKVLDSGKPAGQYLMPELICGYCGNIGTQTDDCTWHHSHYGYDRIVPMGSYYPRYKRPPGVDKLSQHIDKLKNESKAYAEPIGLAMSLCAKSRYREILEADLLVPVPLHPDKTARRGYNQALELARVLTAELKGHPKIVEALSKTRDISVSSGKMDWHKRQQVVKGLYEQQDMEPLEGKRVLLIDDIVTTGFDVSECAKILKQAGCVEVVAFCAGRNILVKLD